MVVLGALGPGRWIDLPLLAAELAAVVLVREVGHAAAWRRAGFRPRIRLYWLGGQTTPVASRTVSLARSLMILLAGPAATLALAGVAQRFGFAWLSQLALGWGLVSLLPIQ